MRTKKLLLCLAFILILSPILIAQGDMVSFTEKEILEGCAHRENTSYFVFSTAIYKKHTAKKVVVTGSFRGWSTDMEDQKWHLTKRKDKLWILAFENANFAKVAPTATLFKFRTDEGEWLAPPTNASNEQGGNLVFMKGQTAPNLRAEINKNGTKMT
jgi:hypothetical protein